MVIQFHVITKSKKTVIYKMHPKTKKCTRHYKGNIKHEDVTRVEYNKALKYFQASRQPKGI